MTNIERLFVLDDDSSARAGFERLLRSAGYDVRVFACADEFRDAFAVTRPRGVVLDAGMLHHLGVEMQTELTVRSSSLPVIVIAADDNPREKQKAQKIHAAGFFRKPVDGIALLDAIAWALRLSSPITDQRGSGPV